MKKVDLSLSPTSTRPTANIAQKCPHCGNNGTFESVDIDDLILFNEFNTISHFLGIRRCPNADCNGQLFFVKYKIGGDETIDSYPVQRIDFDTADIPFRVSASLREAIDSHANGNNIAAAIMVRKTLEELCYEQGAKGDNLKKRIEALSAKIVLPQALVKGMDTLRLLGNDAAHIEATVFSEIGTKELEVAIKFTKELLKNTYQYDSLLKELDSLKTAKE